MLGHSVCYKPTQTHRNVSSCAPRGRACTSAHEGSFGWRSHLFSVCAETRQLFTNCEMKSKQVKQRILVMAQEAILINLRRAVPRTKQNWNIWSSPQMGADLSSKLHWVWARSGKACTRRLHFNNSCLHNERTFALTWLFWQPVSAVGTVLRHGQMRHVTSQEWSCLSLWKLTQQQ